MRRFGTLGLSSSGAIGRVGTRSLADVITSTVFDLDATKSLSYSTGQTWSNLVATPADSSAQTAYDFYLGADNTATTDDPTFNGTPGTAAAYWTLDGADRFGLAGSMTTFLNNLHKTTGGADFWIAIAFRFVQNDAQQQLFATGTSTATTTGVWLLANSNESLAISQGAGAGLVSLSTAAPALVNGTDYLAIVSHSHSGNQSRIWLNSTTATEGAHTFSTTTSAPTGTASIGRSSGGNGGVPNGTRIYGAYGGNEYLTNTKAAAIFTALETRHARDYTP